MRAMGVAAVILLAACAGLITARIPLATGLDTPVRMEVRRTPLGVGGAVLAQGVTFAGGIVLRGEALHGLSDLKLVGDQAWTVSDFGALVKFRIRLDGRGRLVGAEGATSRPLIDDQGFALTPKVRADAEGLAILDDGRVLISFERDDRIWSYGDGAGDRPDPVAQPDIAFFDNEGVEGLSAGAGATWLALGEAGGAWACGETGCAALPGAPTALAGGYRFTAADRDPSGGWFVVERFYSAPLTMRIRVRRMDVDGALGPALIALSPPASVDNFEGLAAVARPGGGTRLYLLSDDNANPLQRTLMLAFDLAAPAE